MTTKARINATEQSLYIAQYALCRKAEEYYTKVCVANKNKTTEHVNYAKKIHEEVLRWANIFTQILNQEGEKFKLYKDASQQEQARNRYTINREISLHRSNRGAVVGTLGAVAAGSAAAAYAYDGDADDAYPDYGPSTNIDGTPMIANSGVDIHGHAYGASSSWSDNSWSGDGGGWSGGGWSDD